MRKIFFIIEAWGLKIFSLILAIAFGTTFAYTKKPFLSLFLCWCFSMLFIVFVKLDEGK